MVSIEGLIPKIEGFQPIPNAVMIPFMETQSAALAFGFGLNYEYGKRTIRSMSNETFNSLTSEQVAEMSAQHSSVLLNRFIQAVPQVMPAQTEIFKQYVTIEKAKVLQNFALAKWTLADLPGILLGLNIDIRDIERDISPSKIGTTITQDKFGNVTTTQAPKAHEITLEENLTIKDKPIKNIGGKITGTTTAVRIGTTSDRDYTTFRAQDPSPWNLADHGAKPGNTSGPPAHIIATLNQHLQTNPKGYRFFRILYVATQKRSWFWLEFLK